MNAMKKKPEPKGKAFSLAVPLDASGIKDAKPGEAVKVVVKNRKGTFHAQTIKLGKDKKGTATFNFPTDPGPLRVFVGPADASNTELEGLQTISMDVSSRQWRDTSSLRLRPIRIPPYYWHWWLIWCRTFTIRGRVVCPDGSPMPAATVCAYDVDRWFFWSSTQQIGCATTDITGAFEITFRWCCGWWPWWWWRFRSWQRDPILAQRVSNELLRMPDVRLSPTPSNQPTLAVFNNLLAEEGLDTSGPLQPADVNRLDLIRTRLLQKLPASRELERLRIWPWWPWYPWRDCTPDVIFRVTQDCVEPDVVIVNETVDDTRWNIDNPLNVTLIANELACCGPTPCQDPPCDEGECLIFTTVCNNGVSTIGGNPGAPVLPATFDGYLRPNGVTPGTATYNGDRPFGGTVRVWKNAGDMINVDYYEVEYHDGVNWKPLPPGAGMSIGRRLKFFEDATDTFSTIGTQIFPYDALTFPGHKVYESREHFEANGPYSPWWPDGAGDYYYWETNEFEIIRLDSTKFPDGTYRFRVRGFELGAGGTLVNDRILPFCSSEEDNYLVLTFDNRIIDPTLSASGPCSSSILNCTLHVCTTEPTTDFISVKIGGQTIDPCKVVDEATGMLEIEFEAYDPDGHLGGYTLYSKYGEDGSVNLLGAPLSAPGASLVSLSGGQVGPTYGEALGEAFPATAPHWGGGTMKLTVPASMAFPEPCCYQLELRAWKRTVVSCNHHYPHCNLSEYTLGVGACLPILRVTPIVEEHLQPLAVEQLRPRS